MGGGQVECWVDVATYGTAYHINVVPKKISERWKDCSNVVKLKGIYTCQQLMHECPERPYTSRAILKMSGSKLRRFGTGALDYISAAKSRTYHTYHTCARAKTVSSRACVATLRSSAVRNWSARRRAEIEPSAAPSSLPPNASG